MSVVVCANCGQFTLLAAEAVMMMSHRSLLGSSAHKSTRVTGHWMLMLLAAISAVLGTQSLLFIYIYIYIYILVFVVNL